MAISGYVGLCIAMYGYVELCSYVGLFMDMYGNIWLCMAV